MRDIIVRNGRRANTPFAPSSRGFYIIRASRATPAGTIGGECHHGGYRHGRYEAQRASRSVIPGAYEQRWGHRESVCGALVE